MEFDVIGYGLYGPSAAAEVASCGLDSARHELFLSSSGT